jgi:hypothetical protein
VRIVLLAIKNTRKESQKWVIAKITRNTVLQALHILLYVQEIFPRIPVKVIQMLILY